MDPYMVSLNQVNFDKQTLADGGDEIESFANIVSYEDDFKSHNSYPIESKKVYFENDNGLYLQQERIDSLKNDMHYLHDMLNKNEGIISTVSHKDDVLPNSFRAFTETTDALHLQETLISFTNNGTLSQAPLESTSKLNMNFNKNATLKESQNLTHQAFQLDSHHTPPINHRKNKNIVEVIVHNQPALSSNLNSDFIKPNDNLESVEIKSEVIKKNITESLDKINFIETSTRTSSNEITNSNIVNNLNGLYVSKDEIIVMNKMFNSKEPSTQITNDIQLFQRSLNSDDKVKNNNALECIDAPINKFDKNFKVQSKHINFSENNIYEDNINHIYVHSDQNEDRSNYKSGESKELKSWDLERAHLIGQLEIVEAELRLVLTERSSLRTKVASLEEQLKIFGSTAEDRDALCVDLETMRMNQSRLEGVIVEAHTLLTDRDLEIQQLNTTIQQMNEEWETMQTQIINSKKSIESREAISIDLKAKITELYIELQLVNQKNLLVDNQRTSIEGDLKAANATKLWFKDQLEQTEKELKALRDELTNVRGKHIQRGTELEKCKAELARSKRLVVDTEQRLLSEKQILVAYLERIESEMMQRDAQQDAANRTYLKFIERKPEESDVEVIKDETKSFTIDSSMKVAELESIKISLEKRLEHYEQALEKNNNLEKENCEKIFELNEELNGMRSQMEYKNSNINQLERKCQSLEVDLSHIRDEKRFIDESMVKLKSDLKLIDQNFSSMKEELRKKQLHNEKLITQVNLLVKELDALKLQKQRTKLSGFEILQEIHVAPNFNFQGASFTDSGIQAEIFDNDADARNVSKYVNNAYSDSVLVPSDDAAKLDVNLNPTDRNEQSISLVKYNDTLANIDVVGVPANESKTFTKSLNKNCVTMDTDTQTDVDKQEILIFPFSKNVKYSSVAVQTRVGSFIDAETQAGDGEENFQQVHSNIDINIPKIKDLNFQVGSTQLLNIPKKELRDFSSNTIDYKESIVAKDTIDVGMETIDIHIRNLKVTESVEKSRMVEDATELYLIDATQIQTIKYLDDLKSEESVHFKQNENASKLPFNHHTNHSVTFIPLGSSQEEMKKMRTDVSNEVASVHGNHWLPEWERLQNLQKQLENEKILLDKEKLIVEERRMEHNDVISRFDLLSKHRDDLEAQLKNLNVQLLNFHQVRGENISLLEKLSSATVDNDNLKKKKVPTATLR